MRGKRKFQVGGQIKTAVSEVIRTRLSDPRIGFVTVTDVEMSDDLRYAKIYFSVLGEEEQLKNSLKILKGARKFIQTETASRIRIRFMPEIDFYIDKSLAYGARIEELLNSVQDDLDTEEPE
ncbi:30S ribosome-binding factor RbfA [bacterium]|nr:30S ribosome-binding factor RbfA [bacterium]